MSYIALHRALDGAVIAMFMMLLSAVSLWMCGQLYNLAISAKYAEYKIGPALKLIFRGRFDYNLTHVLLFALIICLLCVRPDAECLVKTKNTR